MQSGGTGSPGADANASCQGSADGNSGHRDASEESDKTAWLLRITEQRVGHRAVVTPVGDIDISTVARLRRALETAGVASASEIWLDLTHTTFMDCSGLRVLLELRARCRETGRRLVLICAAGPVLRLLTVTGVDRDFEIYPTRAAAQYAD